MLIAKINTCPMYIVSQKKTHQQIKQKWPNMAGLSTFQSGPMGSKKVQNGKPRCFWQFGTLLGPFGPFQTKNHFLPYKDKVGFGRGAFEQKINFLFEMIQKGPDVPKRVPNGQTHLGWSFRTLLYPFGPFWNVDKPAMLGHFCLFYWCVIFWDTLYVTTPPPPLHSSVNSVNSFMSLKIVNSANSL